MIQNIICNNSINHLVERGRQDISVLKPTEPGHINLNALSAEDMNDFHTCLIEPARACRAVFQDIGIVETVSGEDLYTGVEAAFNRFDNLVFFDHGLEMLLDRNDGELSFKGVDLEKMFTETSAAVDELTVWFHENVCPLRLAPFNELRRNRLEQTGQPYRFLFPWYEVMADAPEDILIQFERYTAHIFHYIKTGTASAEFTEAFGDDALLYLAELRADRALVTAIHDNARLGRDVMAFAQHHPQAAVNDEIRCTGILMPGELFKYIPPDDMARFENSYMFKTTFTNRLYHSRHAFLDESVNLQPPVLSGRETVIAIPWLRQEPAGNRELFFDSRYYEKTENPLFKRACRIYDYAQHIGYSYFVCFLDRAFSMFDKIKPQPLPETGLPIELEIPDRTGAVLLAIGYEDWIEQEWQMIEQDKTGKKLKVYFILLTPGG